MTCKYVGLLLALQCEKAPEFRGLFGLVMFAILSTITSEIPFYLILLLLKKPRFVSCFILFQVDCNSTNSNQLLGAAVVTQ